MGLQLAIAEWLQQSAHGKMVAVDYGRIGCSSRPWQNGCSRLWGMVAVVSSDILDLLAPVQGSLKIT